ncbi:MAG TPA: hypothetical protein VLL76_00025 [Candidatus Omnitrophota bacterium]|nr:hypothetical protein [Candidatus Omnitrophota bacterium]
MGGFFGGAPPAPDNSALEDARRERDELRKKNDAKMANIRGRQDGRSALLAFNPEDKTLSDKLGG